MDMSPSIRFFIDDYPKQEVEANYFLLVNETELDNILYVYQRTNILKRSLLWWAGLFPRRLF